MRDRERGENRDRGRGGPALNGSRPVAGWAIMQTWAVAGPWCSWLCKFTSQNCESKVEHSQQRRVEHRQRGALLRAASVNWVARHE